ncbi:MAG: Thermonuclease precursor [Verrucomicrobiota bacterium]|jgi:endonuclease YncB( thermonuclease family)
MIRLLFLGILLTLTAVAEEIKGTVVRVSDGDTIVVLDAGKTQHKIRLAGIDAPESHQAYGDKAKDSLAGMVAGKEVRVEVAGKDRYGREIGRVFAGALDVNLEQVKTGFAWHYAQYAKDAKDLAEAQEKARAGKLGLWKDKEPVAPWEFRKAKKT